MNSERACPEVSIFALAELLQSKVTAFPDDAPLPCRIEPARTLPDNFLLRELFGHETLREALGHEGSLFALIFGLRHAVARLSFAIHAESLEASERMGFEDVIARKFSPELALCPRERKEVRALLPSLPVVGFSALGVHLFRPAAGRCRAFDAYDLTRGCENPAHTFGLCERHAREAPWSEKPTGTQAVMFGFFADKDNVHLYSDAELAKLVDRFWNHFATSPRGSHALLPALTYFGYTSREELATTGLDSLRKLFLQRARRLHPDAGGSAGAFVELRTHYEALRAHFQN